MSPSCTIHIDPLPCWLVSLSAVTVSQVSFPHARRLISHPEGVHRVGGRLLVGVRAAGRLQVFDVEALLAGDVRPVVEFPVPWPDRAWPGNTFTPDLTTAVWSGPDRVRAIDPAGAVRWEWRHEETPWGVGEDGSTFATADGRQVWAVVPGTDNPEWIVLDAATGRLIDRSPLPWRANGYRHLAHPDGRRVGLNLIADDICGMFWGRRALPMDVVEVYSEEEIVADVDPTGRLMATVHTTGYFIRLRQFPAGDAVVAWADSREVGRLLGIEANGYLRHWWRTRGGFLDARMYLACCRESGTNELTHWLFNVPFSADGEYADEVIGGQLSGPIRYPAPVAEHLWPLGDTTWLTADAEALHRWRLAPGPV